MSSFAQTVSRDAVDAALREMKHGLSPLSLSLSLSLALSLLLAALRDSDVRIKASETCNSRDWQEIGLKKRSLTCTGCRIVICIESFSASAANYSFHQVIIYRNKLR